MKICCISDTHGLHKNVKLPPADILVFAGDMCSHGYLHEVQNFADWLSQYVNQYSKIITIAGNHDWAFQKQPSAAIKYIEDAGAIYLENQEIIIDGIKFYGSPVQPWFCNWAFNVDRGPAIRKYWDAIPDDVDVLITHGPPHDILDVTDDGDVVGCEELADKICDFRRLKLHCFGHIHEGYGTLTWASDMTFVNASICTVSYVPSNLPIVVDI